ncbi:hypothetical protein SK128_026183 [Halocaridina rubra]|uniref:type I protein arginine methyltransferase n=1 Tax=Halocaridina rubra TaxID=373956 RepID=A0AAN8XK20_HALRR
MPDPEPDDMSVSMASLERTGGEVSPVPMLEVGNPDPLQNEYFTSYEDVEIHRLMVNDKPRTDAYADAILKNKHLFEGKIVMDVGAGTGILSLFMASAGAKKVYAVEASGIANVIEKVSVENGFGDVIYVFHCKVEDVLLDNEKVDVIVSEWMGFYLLHESMLNSVIYARDKFLAEDGTVFPSEARIYACPCTLQTLYREQVNFWDSVYNFNMSAVKEYALKSKMVKPEVCLVSKSDLLAEPTCIKTFNLRWVTEEEVKTFTETTFVAITRPGLYQGLCLWFECDFDGRDYDEDGKEYGSIITLSTSPSRPPTHWKQTVVVLGYGTEAANQQADLSCQEADDSGGQGRGHEPQVNESDEGLKSSESTNQDSGHMSTSAHHRSSSECEPLECKHNKDDFQVNPDYEVDEDEVVGWRIAFAQSNNKVRHYTMTVEMLDPETEEHPIPCACPMARCLIIAKMMEREEMGEDQEIAEKEEEEDFIDCT